MTITEISKILKTSNQNISQTLNRAIKKLFHNARNTYKLSYTEALEMCLVGLHISNNIKDIKFFVRNLSDTDRLCLIKENEK
jgi:transcriptional regulator